MAIQYVSNASRGPLEFQYGGTFYMLPGGVSEHEDYIAQHVAARYGQKKVTVHPDKEAAETAYELGIQTDS